MKILVFGGSGFLGSHVADELSRAGHAVTIFDIQDSKYRLENQKMILGDILDHETVSQVVKNFDVVYNFAGHADLNASIRLPLQTLQLNVMGNANITDACARSGTVKRYVYASTLYVLSNKGSFYGVSKRCSEQLIEEYHREFGLEYSILRYGSVYGARADKQNRIYRILTQAVSERKVTFDGNGEEEREYIHVRDAATLSVQILASEFANQHVMLTGVERFRYDEVLKIINEVFDNKLKIEYLNKDYKGHYTITPYSFRPSLGKKLVANPFIDFGQGLLDTIQEIHDSLNESAQRPTAFLNESQTTM